MRKEKMRKLIRLLLKIPLTPVVVFFHIFVVLMFFIFPVIYWIYKEDCDTEWEISKEIRNDQYQALKNWFGKI